MPFSPIARRWCSLVALTLALALPACQRQDEAQLVLLTTGGSIRKVVEVAADEFRRENPGVKVQIVTTPAKDYYVKSLAMLAGRAHVDILWMGQGFGMFASRKALLDLEPLARNSAILLETDPAVLAWYRDEDHLYGIPYGIDLQLIAYNKDWLDEAGIAYPSHEWTVDNMLSLARKLNAQQKSKEEGGRRTALGLREVGFRYFGLSLLKENNTRFALNTTEGDRWLNLNISLLQDEGVLMRGAEQDSMDRLSSFLNRQVAIIDAYTWDLEELRNRALFRWGIAALPRGNDGQRRGWASGSAFCIARHSRHPELAWKLIEKLTDTSFQRAMFHRMAPARPALNAECIQALQAPPEDAPEVLKMLPAMDPDPRIAEFMEANAEWQYWMEKALLRQISAKEALKEAQSHIDRILAERRRAMENRGKEGGRQ